MINQGLIFLLIFFGLLFLAIGVVKDNKVCNNEKVIYRYIPRTPDEENSEPVFVSDLFETMFSQPSPWVNSINNYDRRKQEVINKYFISQA